MNGLGNYSYSLEVQEKSNVDLLFTLSSLININVDYLFNNQYTPGVRDINLTEKQRYRNNLLIALWSFPSVTNYESTICMFTGVLISLPPHVYYIILFAKHIRNHLVLKLSLQITNNNNKLENKGFSCH